MDNTFLEKKVRRNNMQKSIYIKRAQRIRSKLKNNNKSDRYRVSIYRSSKNISAQIIDDKNKKTIVSVSSLKDKIGNLLGTKGKEFGTVTSRKRRCGWFDAVLVRQTIKISGVNGIALTKLDVLDELDEIKMCIAYELNGKQIDYLPAGLDDQLKVKPIYETFPGWKKTTKGIRNVENLPDQAKKYIYALEDFIGAKISSISTSPEREDTILIENPFA